MLYAPCPETNIMIPHMKLHTLRSVNGSNVEHRTLNVQRRIMYSINFKNYQTKRRTGVGDLETPGLGAKIDAVKSDPAQGVAAYNSFFFNKIE